MRVLTIDLVVLMLCKIWMESGVYRPIEDRAGFSLSRALFRKNVGPLPVRIAYCLTEFTRHAQ